MWLELKDLEERLDAAKAVSDCPCSGCTDYPDDEPRCPECGYTAGDAAVMGDHHPPYCSGIIPKKEDP